MQLAGTRLCRCKGLALVRNQLKAAEGSETRRVLVCQVRTGSLWLRRWGINLEVADVEGTSNVPARRNWRILVWGSCWKMMFANGEGRVESETPNRSLGCRGRIKWGSIPAL